jgi:energy-coupling factor transporter ATP-binding protein EcfA2
LVPDQVEIDASREVFRARYNVELVVFLPTPGWPEVPRFLEELAHRVSQQGAPTRPRDIEPVRLIALRLENIGPFRSFSLNFEHDWNVFLGNNGSGKSTLLRAIALVLCGDDSRALNEGSRLLRSTADTGFVELDIGRDIPRRVGDAAISQRLETYRTELSRDRAGVHVNVRTQVSPLKMGRWVALAFPPLRGISVGNPKGPTADSAPSPVVEDVLPILVGQTDARMESLKQWLVNLDVRSRPGEGISEKQASRNLALRDRFFEVFNAFVPGVNVAFVGVDRNTWQVTVATNGVEIGIDQVSQGTSSMLGWVGALLQRMSEIHGASQDPWTQAAVVLIDEIDAHLHPEWQQKIVATLKSQFENVQFVATTHSPLIVGELEAQQVYRVRWEDGDVIAAHPAHSVKGLGVAGVLTSEMFGLSSTLDEATRELLEKQRRIAGSESLSDGQKIELEQVNAELETLGFRYQVRDEHFSEYLKGRHQLDLEQTAPGVARSGPSQVPDERVKELVKEAVARVALRTADSE